jgi:hypothetical protein
MVRHKVSRWKSVHTVVHVPVEDSAATAAATSSLGTPSCGVTLKQARIFKGVINHK